MVEVSSRVHNAGPVSSIVSIWEDSGIGCMYMAGWGLLSCPLPSRSLTFVAKGKKRQKPVSIRKMAVILEQEVQPGGLVRSCSLTLWT